MSDAEDLCFANPSDAVLRALSILLLLALAIACFIGGWLVPELVALLTAGLLMATGVLTFNEALAGFGSHAHPRGSNDR